MAKFYVGQRVRCVDAINKVFKRMIGKEGTITGSFESKVVPGSLAWVVNIDGHGECWYPNFDGPCAWSEHHLEPLIPPHEAGDWAVIDKLLPNLRTQEVTTT